MLIPLLGGVVGGVPTGLLLLLQLIGWVGDGDGIRGSGRVASLLLVLLQQQRMCGIEIAGRCSRWIETCVDGMCGKCMEEKFAQEN